MREQRRQLFFLPFFFLQGGNGTNTSNMTLSLNTTLDERESLGAAAFTATRG